MCNRLIGRLKIKGIRSADSARRTCGPAEHSQKFNDEITKENGYTYNGKRCIPAIANWCSCVRIETVLTDEIILKSDATSSILYTTKLIRKNIRKDS